MKDFIPKGTGNSRWMKSSIPTGTTWEEALAMLRAGTFPFDLNGVNSAGVAQMGDALNKANLLPDAVGALYGLGADAVVKDVLTFLGKYNQHWWRRRKTVGNYVPVLNLQYHIPRSIEDDNYIYCGRSSNASGSGLNTEGTVRYSDALNIDGSGRIVGLKEPVKTVTLSYNKYTNAEVLKGKYLAMKYNWPAQSVEEERGFMYVAPTATILRTTATQVGFVYSTLSAINITTKAGPGDWEYLQSSDRSAYPDSGKQDGYEYQYFGVPFENAVTAPKIATGSYVGTGKYGSSNKNNAYIGFIPKLFLVYSTYDYPEFGVFKCEAMTDTDKGGMFMDVSTSNDITGNSARFITDSGGGVRWWSADNEERQFNRSGETYYYFALG